MENHQRRFSTSAADHMRSGASHGPPPDSGVSLDDEANRRHDRLRQHLQRDRDNKIDRKNSADDASTEMDVDNTSPLSKDGLMEVEDQSMAETQLDSQAHPGPGHGRLHSHLPFRTFGRESNAGKRGAEERDEEDSVQEVRRNQTGLM